MTVAALMAAGDDGQALPCVSRSVSQPLVNLCDKLPTWSGNAQVGMHHIDGATAHGQGHAV